MIAVIKRLKTANNNLIKAEQLVEEKEYKNSWNLCNIVLNDLKKIERESATIISISIASLGTLIGLCFVPLLAWIPAIFGGLLGRSISDISLSNVINKLRDKAYIIKHKCKVVVYTK